MSMLRHGADLPFEAGETILWQGQPMGGVIWRDVFQMRTVMGVFFIGFAIFWIIGARSTAPADEPLFRLLFPLLGVPFVLIGIFLTVGQLFWDALLRSGTHYTLTTQNAFIARHLFGRRSLETWPLAEIEEFQLIDGHPGSVLFDVSAGLRLERARPLPVKAPFTFKRPSIGFRQIEDPRRVYRLINETRARS